MVVLSNLNSLTQSVHSHTRCLARLPLGRLLPLVGWADSFLCLWDQLVWMPTTTITQVEPLAVMTDEQRQEAAAKRDLESQHLQCEVVFPGAVQRWGLANVVSMLYERSGTTIANYPGTTTSPQSWQASALWRSSLALASSSQDAPD